MSKLVNFRWDEAFIEQIDKARGSTPRSLYVRRTVEAALRDEGEPTAFGHWLAGFIDGEGSFAIVARQHGDGQPSYRCRLVVRLRDDDFDTLKLIHEQTGIGTLRHDPRKEQNPQATWTVESKRDAVALCELLDRHPLRAKKSRDYAIWREAVQAWQGIEPYTGVREGPIHARLAALKRQLENGRQYIPAPAEQGASLPVAPPRQAGKPCSTCAKFGPPKSRPCPKCGAKP